MQEKKMKAYARSSQEMESIVKAQRLHGAEPKNALHFEVLPVATGASAKSQTPDENVIQSMAVIIEVIII